MVIDYLTTLKSIYEIIFRISIQICILICIQGVVNNSNKSKKSEHRWWVLILVAWGRMLVVSVLNLKETMSYNFYFIILSKIWSNPLELGSIYLFYKYYSIVNNVLRFWVSRKILACIITTIVRIFVKCIRFLVIF